MQVDYIHVINMTKDNMSVVAGLSSMIHDWWIVNCSVGDSQLYIITRRSAWMISLSAPQLRSMLLALQKFVCMYASMELYRQTLRVITSANVSSSEAHNCQSWDTVSVAKAVEIPSHLLCVWQIGNNR